MMISDPAMLLSMVNMWLRDSYSTLDELCEAKDLDKASVEASLAAIGYYYDESHNQFK